MKSKFGTYWIRSKALLLGWLCIALGACFDPARQAERVKWQETVKKEDKNPYGTFLAYHSLSSFFPEAAVTDLSDHFHFSNMDAAMKDPGKGGNLVILVGLNFDLSDKEWEVLRQFVRTGNELMIFSNGIDRKIGDELGCYTTQPVALLYEFGNTRLNSSYLQLASQPGVKYTYKGKPVDGYLTNGRTAAFQPVNDSVSTSAPGSVSSPSDPSDDSDENGYVLADTLGFVDGRADCIRFMMGNGHLTLHAAPLVMSNYFLLQEDNIRYLAAIWQSVPGNIAHIYWCNFLFRSGQDTDSGILWRYPATRWGLWLSLLLAVVYILFEARRRQRIIPVIAPVKNDSVSFVETVGRLYYNKGDNNNLAEKMIVQYLEWVRMHYFLNTNLLNDDFIKRLAAKSGESEAIVASLVGKIHDVRLRTANNDDAYLYQLYRDIQRFYKNSTANRDNDRK